jgi:hypothetical protein
MDSYKIINVETNKDIHSYKYTRQNKTTWTITKNPVSTLVPVIIIIQIIIINTIAGLK